MSKVEERLQELGLTVPDVAKPVAAYVPAIQDGRRIYTSGQLPMVSGALAQTGKVGDGHGLVPAEDAAKLAEICALNAIAAVKSIVGDLDRVTQVVKVVGFVASDPSFTGQPVVINGASELLGKAFGDAGIHARSAVGVAVLPLDAERIRCAYDIEVLSLVVELGQEMPHRVDSGPLLVVALDRGPGCLVGVGAAEHLLLGRGVDLPLVQRLQIHG